MPELEEGGANAIGGGGGGGGLGGGTVEGNGAAQDAGDLSEVDRGGALDDGGRPCAEVAAELAAENEMLRGRVAELESALAGVERRFELERALSDAGVIDLETALAVADGRVASGEAVPSIVSELVASKPFLFRVARSPGRGSASGGAAVGSESSLSGLADEARKTGDRRALTRYLRKRRQG